MNWRRLIAAGVVAFSPVLVGCTNNPTTGRSQLNLLSRDEEIAIGEEAKSEVTTEYGGKVANQAVQNYLSEVGMKLAAQTEGENPSLPWEYTLLDSDVVNAFALPGGKTFITRGLVELLDDEAELAFIMGHETGHVTARHQNEQISRQLGASLVVAGAGIAIGQSDNGIVQQAVPTIISGAGGLYLLRFGRTQELEADRLGMRYMTRSGYDPKAALDAMKVLENLAKGAAREPEFLSTHPYPENRIEQINDMLRHKYAKEAADPSLERYAARYQQNMLRPLALAWPAAPAGRGFVLADTATWCALCAAERSDRAGPRP
jgi:predicted Zn-dependent protease